jgi:acyl-homoserine-lactone acylase
MIRLFVALLALSAAVPAVAATPAESARWRAHAHAVTITRDDWGVAHVKGTTDADAVFGMIYAQAEDDFPRIEANYLTNLGRMSEAEGPSAVWQDLRQRLFVDPAQLKTYYASAAPWLRMLMQAWADGLNYYLAMHPQVHPRVLTHFEPWMALSFSEGSIGGDIERVSLSQLQAFYEKRMIAMSDLELGRVFREPQGSNGIALAPARTKDGHALLLINPHTSFFFRAEQQVTSGQGLNVYGAATWGQFFIYQGFNAHAGWMHTSTGVDNVDEFAETIVRKGGGLYYRYGKADLPVTVANVTLSIKGAAPRSFPIYRTGHGPVVREADGKWIAVALMNKPLAALEQSFLRTKTHDYASFLKIAEHKANSSNNTLFADDRGEIAFLTPQFMPIRDNRFDYSKPVDGSDPATDWKGLHSLASLPQMINPGAGFVSNVNNWPWSTSGPGSIRADAFPRYFDRAGESPRGLHALMLFDGKSGFTLDSLVASAYDSYLPAFARLLPSLVASYDALPAGDPRKAKLAEPIALLRQWDFRWSAASPETSLAVFWGENMWRTTADRPSAPGLPRYDLIAKAAPAEQLDALQAAVDRLSQDFGSWRVPWGEINRFQRNDGAIVQTFDDARPSIPVPFTASQWGSLAAFGARRYPGTRRYYGTVGNSFVAAVEFGPRVKARAVTAGGESGHPESPHFDDEALRYASGDLRPVYFYPDELKGHVERMYRPGE